MKGDLVEIKVRCRGLLEAWLASCTRRGKLSRNTISMGIVVLDHLRWQCPVSRSDVVTEGGEIRGARGSALRERFDRYGVQHRYLKEATTRQGHQDGQKLFELLEWGDAIAGLSWEERDGLLGELIGDLTARAADWLQMGNLTLELDRRDAPSTWIHLIMQEAKGRSGGVVEQHLVGAKLEKRYIGIDVPNNPAHAADVQTERAGDFVILRTVYHVTAAPSRAVVQKCGVNIKAGQHPVLVVPREQAQKAQVLADDEGVGGQVTIVSVEDFLALNVIEMATAQGEEFYSVLQGIVQTYNRRLAEVETDLSLRINIPGPAPDHAVQRSGSRGKRRGFPAAQGKAATLDKGPKSEGDEAGTIPLPLGD